ncbi:MAG TPA: hypothetical protein VFQ53_21005 [Kofleriaceae bacterium]|nr:hypothetical protein [Kofleriaceae bacterium]
MKTPSAMHRRLLDLRGGAEPPQIQPAPRAESREAELLQLLLAPLRDGETATQGHDRKEREVGAWFAQLAPIDAFQLHRRLANPRSDDALAAAFGRMIPARRLRLLAFLGDAKRRAAMLHAAAHA